MEYRIREIRPDELQLLDDFLYLAIFQPDDAEVLPREVIHTPEIYNYVQDFGRPDDLCLVAEINDAVVGAVWTRILAGDIPGYGNVDDSTPEFAVSVSEPYRQRGIGTELMRSMLNLLKQRGYAQASLSVQKDNPATRLYQRLGFKIVQEREEDYLMVHELR